MRTYPEQLLKTDKQ